MATGGFHHRASRCASSTCCVLFLEQSVLAVSFNRLVGRIRIDRSRAGKSEVVIKLTSLRSELFERSAADKYAGLRFLTCSQFSYPHPTLF